MNELKRTEILFIYEVQNANPNGDPMDDNKPRIDEESGLNIVTDVRLKRTIRDYLFEHKGYNGQGGKDIFVRQSFVDDDPALGLNDGKARSDKFQNSKDNILQECIDVRMFGAVIPTEVIEKDTEEPTEKDGKKGKKKKDKTVKGSITLTGPIQFKMGHSLHKVNPLFIKGTGAFASQKGKHQNTFREEYILPYSAIVFYGIINEKAAENTKLTTKDVSLFFESIWEGTRNLITRSKFEHNPLLLMTLEYDESNYFIGSLDKYVKLITNENMEEKSIRSTEDYVLNLEALQKRLDLLEEKKKPNITLRVNPSLNYVGLKDNETAST